MGDWPGNKALILMLPRIHRPLTSTTLTPSSHHKLTSVPSFRLRSSLSMSNEGFTPSHLHTFTQFRLDLVYILSLISSANWPFSPIMINKSSMTFLSCADLCRLVQTSLHPYTLVMDRTTFSPCLLCTHHVSILCDHADSKRGEKKREKRPTISVPGPECSWFRCMCVVSAGTASGKVLLVFFISNANHI